MGLTLEGKNFLLQEQILFVQTKPHFVRAMFSSEADRKSLLSVGGGAIFPFKSRPRCRHSSKQTMSQKWFPFIKMTESIKV